MGAALAALPAGEFSMWDNSVWLCSWKGSVAGLCAEPKKMKSCN